VAHNFNTNQNATTLNLLKSEAQVLHALMLRDIKTRFFGNAWGFLISLAWPLTHILVVLLINTLAGRLPAYGDSAALWFATGIVPFMAFSYMSRFIMIGLVVNRPLLIFPNVKIMDILIARAVVEVLSAGAVILILVAIFTAYGIEVMPSRPVDAVYALGSAFLLGIGAGLINAVIGQALPVWLMGYNLSMIVLWLLSGVLFVPDNLPAQLRIPFTYNPISHSISWFRSAYYDGYGALTLDKTFVVECGLFYIVIGLIMERLFRGRLLQG
jgi:capsular polysaccharide transport system permease protein